MIICEFCGEDEELHRKPGVVDSYGKPLFIPCRQFIENTVRPLKNGWKDEDEEC